MISKMLVEYLNVCTRGEIAFSECTPVWEFLGIAGLVVALMIWLSRVALKDAQTAVRERPAVRPS